MFARWVCVLLAFAICGSCAKSHPVIDSDPTEEPGNVAQSGDGDGDGGGDGGGDPDGDGDGRRLCSDAQYERAPTPDDPGGCSELTICDSTQFESTPPTARSDRVCTALTQCTDAQYESSAPTPTTDRQCTDLTVCAPGQYVVAEPTATSDRVCAACEAGHYSDTENALLCKEWSDCAADQWVRPGTSTTDRLCECLAGASGLHNGDITVTTQAEVEELAGIREISGDLLVDSAEPSSIVSLASLSCLELVGGDLLVRANDALTSLAGLDNLTSIGGYLVVYDNAALTSLAGLDNLTSIGGHLVVRANGALTSLAGLDNLTSIGGHLAVYDNAALTSLAGLDNLTSIGGVVAVHHNSALTSLAGLDNVETIDGPLHIRDNSELPQCIVDEWVAGGVTHGGIGDVTSNNNGDNAVCE